MKETVRELSSRRKKGLMAFVGTSFGLLVIVIIAISLGGNSNSGTTKPAAPTTQKDVTATGQASSTPVVAGKADKPMTKSQWLDIMSWTNDQYQQVYGSFQGLSFGSNDASFLQLEGSTARALSAKGDSIPYPKNVTTDPVAWTIQTDVDQTTNFALAAVADMANYVDGGSQDESQMKQDIAAYQQQYKTTLQEVQTGKLVGK